MRKIIENLLQDVLTDEDIPVFLEDYFDFHMLGALEMDKNVTDTSQAIKEQVIVDKQKIIQLIKEKAISQNDVVQGLERIVKNGNNSLCLFGNIQKAWDIKFLSKKKQNLIIFLGSNRFVYLSNKNFFFVPYSKKKYGMVNKVEWEKIEKEIDELKNESLAIVFEVFEDKWARDIDRVTQCLKNIVLTHYRFIKLLSKKLGDNEIRFITLFELGDNLQGRVANCVSGLYRTLFQEDARFFGKTIGLDRLDDYQIDELLVNEANSIIDAFEVFYVDGRRKINVLERVLPSYSLKNIYVDKGCYLITGGTGKIAQIIARHIMQSGTKRVVLLGRRELKENEKNILSEIGKNKIKYVICDLSNFSELNQCIGRLEEKYGSVNGIFHCAGIIRDSLCINKEEENVLSVLQPKMEGTLHLCRCLENHNISFLVMCSSLAAVTGNVGQSDYAVGNAYMDQLAQIYSNKISSCKVISINWPLWEDGGMQITEERKALMTKATGMTPLPSSVALQVLDTAIENNYSNISVMYGKEKQIVQQMQFYMGKDRIETVPSNSNLEENCDVRNYESIKEYFLEVLKNTLSIEKDDIDIAQSLSEYGLDSIMIEQICSVLKKDQFDIPKSVFYEKETISEILDYMVDNYGRKSDTWQNSSYETSNSVKDNSDIKGVVMRIFAEVIGLDDEGIDEQCPFSEYGMDSIMVEQLNRKFKNSGIHLPSNILYMVENLKELNEYINAEYRGKFDNSLEKINKADLHEDGHQESENKKSDEEIQQNEFAIIGIDIRVAGAADAKQFWDLLCKSKTSITEVPSSKWEHEKYYSNDSDDVVFGKTNCKYGAFLEDGDCFDAEFFGITPNAAQVMDPQERILLESVWHALENAHYTKEELKEKYKDSSIGGVGVFVGATHSSYSLSAITAWINGDYVVPSSWRWAFANRISYFYDFKGPSVPVDTGCSSSLTALYLACQSMADGEADMAVVSGVNLYNHPSLYIGASKLQLLSSQDNYHIFSENSDGFIPGEGVATIIVKPLKKAIEDKDSIYGVIKGVGINHRGKTNTFFAPSVKSERDLVCKVAEKAKVDLNTISYIEVGTTGSALADEMEFNALKEAFEMGGVRKDKCAIGSVKQNIGHLESASSLVAIIKVLLQFRMNQIVPNLFSNKINPNIDFSDSPFYLEYTGRVWEDLSGTKRAMVNSISAGGVNACVILEDMPEKYNTEKDGLNIPGPGYVFKKNKFWIVDRDSEGRTSTFVQKKISSMLDENKSKLGRQIFVKKFTGKEFYLEDHLFVLPAVAYVELICEAVYASVSGVKLRTIRDLVLMQPFVYGHGNRELCVRLILLEQDIIAEVYTCAEAEKVYVRASVELQDELLCLANVAKISYGSFIKDEEDETEAKNYYLHLEKLNSCFGYRFKGIRNIWFQEESALTRAGIVEELVKSKEEFLYHPTIMDAGFQTVVALAYHLGADSNTIYMPFYVGEISFFDEDDSQEIEYIYACIKEKAGNAPDKYKYTLEYMDRGNNVVVRIDDYSIAPLSFDSKKKISSNILGEVREESEKLYQAPNDTLQHTTSYSLETSVEELCKKVLHRNIEFDYEKELLQYGFDSITLTELSSMVNKRFKVKTTPLFFFENNSINLILKGLEKLGISGASAQKDSAIICENDNREDYIERRYVNAQYSDRYAIIGMSGAFPQSENIEVYWKKLMEGKDMTEEIPRERWDWKEYDGDASYGKYNIYCHRGGFIKDVDAFDAKFFGISPVDAAVIDPQQRLVLEHTWAAMEDAGYSSDDLYGTNTSVFVGVSNADYGELLVQNKIPTVLTHSMVTNRISYMLNLTGKSEPCDAACASSLVAIDRAIETLKSGESDMAFAGGVNLLLSPNTYVYECLSKALSPSGKCCAFDKEADGYVRGEGVGIILLKRLEDAVRDYDSIYAVICGHSVGHAGKSSGLTVPNADSQAKVIEQAYRANKIDMNSVTYIEAHGTGTKLGDPIEIDGLNRSFGRAETSGDYDVQHKCAVSSVKTNIGHLEAAAGIASVIKVIMALKNRIIPRVINFKQINPYCNFENSRFHIVAENESWNSSKSEKDGAPLPRRAGISAFGIGGVNSHIVMEEYLGDTEDYSELQGKGKSIFVCSAKSEKALLKYVENILRYIEADKGVTPSLLERMCYTMQLGRNAFEVRLATVVNSLDELAAALENFMTKRNISNILYCTNIKKNKEWVEKKKEEINVNSFFDWCIEQNLYTDLVECWVNGLNLPWERLYKNISFSKLHMPTYPFDKEHFWIPDYYQSNNASGIKSETKLGKTRGNNELIFFGEERVLRDHQVMGDYILPGAFYVEIMLKYYIETTGDDMNCIGSVMWFDNIHRGMNTESIRIILDINRDNKQVTVKENDSKLLASGSVYQKNNQKSMRFDINSYISDSKGVFDREVIYQVLKEHSVVLGDMFKTLKKIYSTEKYCVAEYQVNEKYYDIGKDSKINLLVLDAAFQSILCMTGGRRLQSNQVLLPFMLKEIEVYSRQSRKGYVLALLKHSGEKKNVYVIYILDKDGNMSIKITDYVIKRVNII